MTISLTFDIERDIPKVLDTSFGIKIGLRKILKLLEEFNIKATFFCTGTIANQHPWAISLIEKKGHELACHSLNHERLSMLSYNKCKEIISSNKKSIEKSSHNSEIIGFRTPYLNPPKFLFKLLKELGFKYDSSIPFLKRFKFKQFDLYEIKEFHPSETYAFFRLPLSQIIFQLQMLRKKLLVLYSHSWEAIDIKSLLYKRNLFKDSAFRIDRWLNTGDSFIQRIEDFIKSALVLKTEFVTLNQL